MKTNSSQWPKLPQQLFNGLSSPSTHYCHCDGGEEEIEQDRKMLRPSLPQYIFAFLI